MGSGLTAEAATQAGATTLDRVHAAMSPRYRPLDNFEVLEKLDGLGYPADTRVQCCLDAELMSLSLPDASQTFAVKDDRITPGLLHLQF